MPDVQTISGPPGEVTETPASSADNVEATATEKTEEPNEEKNENAIPHSRVKEMEQKAYEKGKEEALKKLLAEQETKSEPEKKEEDSGETDERAEAMKVLRDAIKAEVGPYLTRQEVKDFLESNPDAVNYTDQIKSLRANNPKLGWEEAYKLASFDDKLKAAESKGVSVGEQSLAAKEGARTEKPSSAPPPKSSKPLSEKLMDRNIPLADLEKELLQNLR